jgi:hypothetical protein
MGKRKKKAPAAAGGPGAGAPAAALVETSLFEPDARPEWGKCDVATLLTAWRPLAIVRVERIEIGDRGWRVVFRE